MIRIHKDGEVIKETEDIQTLVQFLDYYEDHPIKMVEFRVNHDAIEERNRRQAAELGN
jgi:hypothetical protein